MGKKGGNSWLTVVKRAFRSPTKETSQKKSSRRREENDKDEEEEKREKRWLFRKPSYNNEAKVTAKCYCAPSPPPGPPKTTTPQPQVLPPGPRHAIAVAAATAEAAVATAQAAVEIIRLTRSSNHTSSSSVKQSYAAVVIQTAFRGYLARRALVALKGIVKLQAIIRGQNVRNQAKMTLKCMQALLRLQTRMHDPQARLSHDGGGGRKSMFAETTNLWESRYLRDIRERKSLSKERPICIPDDWSECPRTLEELEAALQSRKEAATATATAAATLKRESSLTRAFSQQLIKIWDSSESGYDEHEEEEVDEERTKRLDKWMPTKQWDTCSRSGGSTHDHKRDSSSSMFIKTVEMDMPMLAGSKQQQQYSSAYYSASSSSSSATANNRRPKLQHQSPHNQKQSAPPHYSAASPGRHRSLNNHYNFCSSTVQPPVTPPPSYKTKPVQARPSSTSSSSCLKEDMKGYGYSYSYSAANTPCSSSLRSMQRLNSSSSISRCRVSNINSIIEGNNNINATSSGIIMLPNYMAATESAKARVRSQSAPRQRPSTPERERGGTFMPAKKRLSFPVPPDPPNNNTNNTNASSDGFSQSLRSPCSFKSVQAPAHVGLELQSNQSFYTDSIGGVISPCSTTDLRRWLR